MDISRAFTYIFDDREWVSKLVIAGAMALLAVIPIVGLVGLVIARAMALILLIVIPIVGLVGLVGLAALLGMAVEIISNMRDDKQVPLPRWDNYADKMILGGNVLLAWIVYNVPNMLVMCGIVTVQGLLRDQTFFSWVSLCCLVPLGILYNFLAGAMMALGTVRYSQRREIAVFFQFNNLLQTLANNGSLTFQWILMSVLVNFILAVFNFVPCFGSIAAVILAVPIQAHLLGQFGRQIHDSPPPKKTSY